jgi:hypothetical protein
MQKEWQCVKNDNAKRDSTRKTTTRYEHHRRNNMKSSMKGGVLEEQCKANFLPKPIFFVYHFEISQTMVPLVTLLVLLESLG